MYTLRTTECWAGVFLLLLALGGGCDKEGSRGAADTPVSLTLGVQPDGAELTALVLLAEDQGMFQENGLSVAYLDCHSGGLVLQALEKGEIDLAFSGEYAVLQRLLQGAEICIIACIATTDQTRIVARKDSGIDVPSDLQGRSIAVVVRSGSEFGQMSFLLTAGLARDAVDEVKFKTAKEAYQALITGEVDAALLHEPYIMMARGSYGTEAACASKPGHNPSLSAGPERSGRVHGSRCGFRPAVGIRALRAQPAPVRPHVLQRSLRNDAGSCPVGRHGERSPLVHRLSCHRSSHRSKSVGAFLL